MARSATAIASVFVAAFGDFDVARRISTALISKKLSPKAKASFVDILRRAGMPD
jgi:hypothetical protein